jgi:hypothetical protein
MASTSYARASAVIDGEFQVELQNVQITMQPGKSQVNTLAKGFSGFSPGSPTVQITFESAIPRGGQEFNFLDAALANTDYEIQIRAGADTYRSVGQFTDANAGQGVDAAATAGATFIGTALPTE